MIDFQKSLSLLFSFTLGAIKEFVDSFDSDTVSRILSYHLAVVFNSTKCIGFLKICRTASAVRNRETRMNPIFLYMLNLSNPILFLWSLRTALISKLHNPELANVWRLFFQMIWSLKNINSKKFVIGTSVIFHYMQKHWSTVNIILWSITRCSIILSLYTCSFTHAQVFKNIILRTFIGA